MNYPPSTNRHPSNDHSSVEVRRKWHITVLLVRAIEFITGDHNYSSVPTKYKRVTVRMT